jgi:hypothetical protein
MKKIIFFIIILSFQAVSFGQKKLKKIELSGFVTDYKTKPIKNAYILIDSIKTKIKTNKKGFYKVVVSKENKRITVFSSNHGLLEMDYLGQDKINFIFPESSKKISNRDFFKLGYQKRRKKSNDYSNYSDVFQLLKNKFFNVLVSEEDVWIKGGGISISHGDPGLIKPLFIVNGIIVNDISNISPSEIKYISAERTKTSLYGSRGAGGIIKIKLK